MVSGLITLGRERPVPRNSTRIAWFDFAISLATGVR